MEFSEFMAYFITAVISGLIFGAITYAMNTSKGYKGGFWWGFFLGIIGIIVIACTPPNEKELERRLKYSGAWICDRCKKTNYSYIIRCSCGNDKPEKRDEYRNEMPVSADELIKYKKLLDDGAITEEEYNDVKKKLLKL